MIRRIHINVSLKSGWQTGQKYLLITSKGNNDCKGKMTLKFYLFMTVWSKLSWSKSKNSICYLCATNWAFNACNRTRFTHCKLLAHVSSKYWKYGSLNLMLINLQQKCWQGRSIAVVVDSKHILHKWEFTSPFGRVSTFSFISCIRA